MAERAVWRVLNPRRLLRICAVGVSETATRLRRHLMPHLSVRGSRKQPPQLSRPPVMQDARRPRSPGWFGHIARSAFVPVRLARFAAFTQTNPSVWSAAGPASEPTFRIAVPKP